MSWWRGHHNDWNSQNTSEVYKTDLGKCGKSSRMPKKVKGKKFPRWGKATEPNIMEMILLQMEVGGMRQ